MVYKPNVPTGLIPLNTDYQNIRANFQQLDTTFGVDHVTYSVQTLQNGYHQSIHFNPISTTATNPPNNNPPVVPSTVAGYGQLFSVQMNDTNNTDNTLFFLTGNGLNLQLTSNFLPSAATRGYTFLPGGIILQWGTDTSTGSTTAINYPKVFPNNAFSVTATRGQGSGSPTFYGVTSVTTTGFDFNASSSSSGVNIRWMAIGN